MKRLATTVLLAISCIAATTTPHAKGMRAIIVYGSAGEGTTVVAENDAATELYISYWRSLDSGDQLPMQKLRSRPCLRIAVFYDNVTNRVSDATRLNPEHANLTYYYFPAVNGEPAATHEGRVMTAALAERLPRYNEEFLKRAEYPPCNPPS
jgi:hypothetical protein